MFHFLETLERVAVENLFRWICSAKLYVEPTIKSWIFANMSELSDMKPTR